MIENSLLIALWRHFTLTLGIYYANSGLSRFVGAITRFFARLWENSRVCGLIFGSSRLFALYEESRINRVLTAFFDRLFSFSRKMGEISGESVIVREFSGLSRNFLRVPAVAYALMLGSAGAVGLVLSFAPGMAGKPLEGGAALLLGALCMTLWRRNFGGLYNGSSVLRLVGGFFGLGEVSEEPSAYRKPLYIALGVILGLVLGKFGALIAAAALLGIFGASLIFSYTEAGILLTAFFLPILPTKFIVGLVAVSIVSFVFKALFSGKVWLKFGLMDFSVLLFALLILYSVAISFYPGKSLFMAGMYLLFILLYYTVRFGLRSRRTLFALFSLVAVSGFFVAAFGVYQKLTGAYIDTTAWIDSEMFEGATVRIYSTLENPNVLGEYLIFAIMITFALLYYQKRPIYKLASLAMLLVCGVCLIFTQSRGAWLGLLLALAVFAFLRDRRLIWLGICGALALPLAMPRSIIDRFTSIGDLTDSSTSYRLNIWLASLLMLEAFWPIGIGLGTDVYTYVFRKYAYTANLAPHAHNLFLQIFISLGIAGLILLLFILFGTFKKALRAMRESKAGADNFAATISAALVAGMAGFMLQGMTDNVWYNYRVCAFFWLITAVMQKLYIKRENGTEENYDGRS